MEDDADYRKLMEIAHIFDEFDVDDISARLEHFTPDNMFVAHWSPSFQ